MLSRKIIIWSFLASKKQTSGSGSRAKVRNKTKGEEEEEEKNSYGGQEKN